MTRRPTHPPHALLGGPVRPLVVRHHHPEVPDLRALAAAQRAVLNTQPNFTPPAPLAREEQASHKSA